MVEQFNYWQIIIHKNFLFRFIKHQIQPSSSPRPEVIAQARYTQDIMNQSNPEIHPIQ